MSRSRPGAVRARIESLLRRFAGISGIDRVLIAFAALGLSVLVGFFIVLGSGRVAECSTAAWTMPITGLGFCYDPFEVFFVLFNGALGGPFYVWEPGILNPEWLPITLPWLGFMPGWSPFNNAFALTMSETTLLVFTGLSVAVAFRAGLFNIGTQGQLVVGALLTALVVVALAPLFPANRVGGVILIAIGVLAGAVGGGLWGAIPGALKAYADANEVITTIMLNFIAANVAYVLVLEVFRAEGSSVVATADVPEYAQIGPWLFPPTGDFAEAALLIGLVSLVGLYLFLEHTSLGYDLRVSGIQPLAAEYSGVNAKLTTVRAMTLSGALGGIGGSIWVLMSEGRWVESIPDLGFDGITVSILAGNNPLGVLPAAALFGVLKGGALQVGFQTDVPPELVGVLRGLIILFVAMPEFFRLIGKRLVPDEPEATRGGDGKDGDGVGGTAAVDDGGEASA
ncbi:inner-membrane translocator [Halorubrum aidingense JCM 13560]|uniref:Inner-membrane translocator n=1 Tax=Halorubrum aidingense JCM 13560 TaxID=1230454 RepID=M0PH92_9EURY|nr:inner-membrane translocator [Halorubrum aidingense JCM 13560]